ncbi:hypothetical protein AVEN_47854-1 [Araneus ventricosus]|uniref:Uncharacterized protein n=1 Tax=Araneus ventricosus TaxID=182803 RepID=A0A4Y2PWR2_ARAVE|nr:hypothetical protein AVEN_47854-1 [Araneus ventricosus]
MAKEVSDNELNKFISAVGRNRRGAYIGASADPNTVALKGTGNSSEKVRSLAVARRENLETGRVKLEVVKLLLHHFGVGDIPFRIAD